MLLWRHLFLRKCYCYKRISFFLIKRFWIFLHFVLYTAWGQYIHTSLHINLNFHFEILKVTLICVRIVFFHRKKNNINIPVWMCIQLHMGKCWKICILVFYTALLCRTICGFKKNKKTSKQNENTKVPYLRLSFNKTYDSHKEKKSVIGKLLIKTYFRKIASPFLCLVLFCIQSFYCSQLQLFLIYKAQTSNFWPCVAVKIRFFFF